MSGSVDISIWVALVGGLAAVSIGAFAVVLGVYCLGWTIDRSGVRRSRKPIIATDDSTDLDQSEEADVKMRGDQDAEHRTQIMIKKKSFLWRNQPPSRTVKPTSPEGERHSSSLLTKEPLSPNSNKKAAAVPPVGMPLPPRMIPDTVHVEARKRVAKRLCWSMEEVAKALNVPLGRIAYWVDKKTVSSVTIPGQGKVITPESMVALIQMLDKREQERVSQERTADKARTDSPPLTNSGSGNNEGATAIPSTKPRARRPEIPSTNTNQRFRYYVDGDTETPLPTLSAAVNALLAKGTVIPTWRLQSGWSQLGKGLRDRIQRVPIKR